MTPSNEVNTIRCLLCRGVVCFTPEDDSRWDFGKHDPVYYTVNEMGGGEEWVNSG